MGAEWPSRRKAFTLQGVYTMGLPQPADDEELTESLDDMDPSERERLEACLEEAVRDSDLDRRERFIPAEEVLKEFGVLAP